MESSSNVRARGGARSAKATAKRALKHWPESETFTLNSSDSREFSYISFIRKSIRKSEEMQKLKRTTIASRSYSFTARNLKPCFQPWKTHLFPLPQNKENEPKKLLIHIEGGFVEFLKKSKVEGKRAQSARFSRPHLPLLFLVNERYHLHLNKASCWVHFLVHMTLIYRTPCLQLEQFSRDYRK